MTFNLYIQTYSKSHNQPNWKKNFNYLGIKTTTCTTKTIKQIVKNNSKNTDSRANTGVYKICWCVAMCEDEWRHNITIANDHLQTPWCGMGIWFSLIWLWICSQIDSQTWKSSYWISWYECQVVLHAISKFLEEWIESWSYFSHRECPTNSCLLHSRRNLKPRKNVQNQ